MTAHPPKFRVYEDRAGEYRWRLVAGNGRTVADSGEGYVTHQGAVNAAFRFKELAAEADVYSDVPKEKQRN